MCGIFGTALHEGACISTTDIEKLLTGLYKLSESRGKESAGIHIFLPKAGKAWTMKGAQPASEFLQTPDFAKTLAAVFSYTHPNGANKTAEPVAIIAHSRLVTNGAASLNRNNQPVRWEHVTMIHNGIIVNVDDLWHVNPHLARTAEVDTEVMAAIISCGIGKGMDHVSVTRAVFGAIKGAASIAWLHDQTESLTLATNTGDLYRHDLPDNAGFVFASERYILEQAILSVWPRAEGISPSWLRPGTGCVFNLAGTDPVQHFPLAQDGDLPVVSNTHLAAPALHTDIATGTALAPTIINQNADETLLRYNAARIRALPRCTRCVLPNTFPFIHFDEKGVCNYCNNYKPRYAGMHPVDTRKAFIQSLEKYRRSNNEPDVLVPFSGGRDSSFGLHLIQKEFGLRPVTFTYDWGMVTDLARRNIARLCGQLGIQNILVSADIKTKRENIRKNVSAWLKKPELGMVPLFMAGDKHFFSIVNKLKKQTGIALDLWCANPLENTDFKSGFCGVPPYFEKKRVDHLSFGRKAKMLEYYARNFLTNPGYLNTSLIDTFTAFLAYYFEPRRDFFFIFDHFIWNEDEVNKTLLSEYDWELSADSPSTWRIGDGTAPFYNYIYMTARGFSEFDTFRSNQIREGQITREAALESIIVENHPRTQSLRWYLDTIGLDFNETIRKINTLDTMGLHR